MRPQRAEDLVRDFWRTVQHRFPRATRVTVRESWLRKATDPPPDEFRILIQQCPASISASASILQQGVDYQLERSLWRLAPGDTTGTIGGWERIDPSRTRQSILPPPKEFRGPVGAFERIHYHFYHHAFRKWAVRLLLIEARERHHFDGRHESFHCFDPNCEVRLQQPGEWTLHAINSGHDSKGEGPIPPEQYKASFDQLKKQLKCMEQQDVHGPMEKMRQAWGDEGSEERHNAERAFLHQLENDPLYAHGKPAKETSTWFLYERAMDPDNC